MNERHVSLALFFSWLTAWLSFVVAGWLWCLKVDSLVATLFWLCANAVILWIAIGIAWWRLKREREKRPGGTRADHV